MSRLLTEAEVRDILQQPLLMRLAFLDEDGWPAVAPVWFLFEKDRLWTTVARGSRKERRLLADQRVYFTIDTSGAQGTYGVRGRAQARGPIDQLNPAGRGPGFTSASVSRAAGSHAAVRDWF